MPRVEHTVKIHLATYKSATALVASIRRSGWAVVGVQRDDTPTLATVIAEGLVLLAKKEKTK